ncbi:MAG: nicotinate-nucleotide adenylyltransferase [Terrimicrobiaceae bacterium]|nr:nicotinate-nucleotide adenylyltransferase [Terrimicrobiaceae bacterium]
MIPPRKIGLYGGSFDPIHHGHLILARTAREELGLDRIVFIPAGISPHKLDRPPAPAAIRCEMVAAAIADEPGFTWSDTEIRRDGPSFAIDTVREFRSAEHGAEIFYFIGEDNLPALDTWKDIEILKTLCRFVVLARGIEEENTGGLPVIHRVIDISSTDIRNRVATGRPVRYLLPESVCDILTRERLYRND